MFPDLGPLDCPSCKRKSFTRNDMLYASIDGTARCRACGRVARLDLLSRWMISCVIALVLPALLLYGNIFYSGHLFVVSLVTIVVGWRVLSLLAFPLLTLEVAPGNFTLQRRQSIFLAIVMLLVAAIIDGFMASRFEL